MAEVRLHLPEEMEGYLPELQFFMQAMLYKLYTNRHKGFAEQRTLHQAWDNFVAEGDEMAQATAESDTAVLMEAADAANCAWLFALIHRRQRLHGADTEAADLRARLRLARTAASGAS